MMEPSKAKKDKSTMSDGVYEHVWRWNYVETSLSKNWEELQDSWRLNEANYEFWPNFGAFPKIILRQATYYFEAWEVKNPMLQTVHKLKVKRRSYYWLKQAT